MNAIIVNVAVVVVVMVLWKLINACYLTPIRAYGRLRKMGFGGPTPCFPMGNLGDMKKLLINSKSSSSSSTSSSSPALSLSQELISHDIHSSALPYFAQWQKLHGKHAWRSTMFCLWYIYVYIPFFLFKGI